MAHRLLPPHPPTSSPRRALRARRGVTLVEMAIVMVIIGLLAAMTIPRIGAGIAQRQLDRTAQQLVVDLQTAAQLAARHRRPVRFSRVGSTGYQVVDRATPTTVYLQRNFGATSGTNATFGSFANVDFFPNGLASAAITVTVTVNGLSRSVSVTRVGHVRRNW